MQHCEHTRNHTKHLVRMTAMYSIQIRRPTYSCEQIGLWCAYTFRLYAGVFVSAGENGRPLMSTDGLLSAHSGTASL